MHASTERLETSYSKVNVVAPESMQAHPSVTSPMKRCLDILGAVVGLAVCVIAFPAIALAIVLDSPGTVIFRQTRYGLNGQPFEIYKFRSMVTDADSLKSQLSNDAKGPIFKCKDDPRVTRVGRFLRSTSLDEFPQFWNVLKGEMSLVGTRPPTGDEVAQYSDHHWQRLHVKPGITGEWQVSGRSSVDAFEDIFQLDLRYQENWTPTYDLQVIAKTVLRVVARKDAW